MSQRRLCRYAHARDAARRRLFSRHASAAHAAAAVAASCQQRAAAKQEARNACLPSAWQLPLSARSTPTQFEQPPTRRCSILNEDYPNVCSTATSMARIEIDASGAVPL